MLTLSLNRFNEHQFFLAVLSGIKILTHDSVETTPVTSSRKYRTINESRFRAIEGRADHQHLLSPSVGMWGKLHVYGWHLSDRCFPLQRPERIKHHRSLSMMVHVSSIHLSNNLLKHKHSHINCGNSILQPSWRRYYKNVSFSMRFLALSGHIQNILEVHRLIAIDLILISAIDLWTVAELFYTHVETRSWISYRFKVH
ncbi:hypothetical protein TNCV_4205081 [Trichonephila clavipes]|nr:hypothetical protein TNCV_4205081 [Trichonephila clavipes]